MARGGDNEARDGGASPSADEDAIRAQLREGGWRKKTAASAEATGETTPRKNSSSSRQRKSSRSPSFSSSRSKSRERRHSSRRHSSSSRRRSRSHGRKKRDEEKDGDATDSDPEAEQEKEKRGGGKAEDMDVDESAADAQPPSKARGEERSEPPRQPPPLAVAVHVARAVVAAPPFESPPLALPLAVAVVASAQRSVSLALALALARSPQQQPPVESSASQPLAEPQPEHSKEQQRQEAEPASTAVAPTIAPAIPPVAPPSAPTAAAAGVSPSITQLMQQHPTLSLQEIIAKMQASSASMAAAAAQKPARELYVGNLPPNVTGPQLQEFLSTIIQQVGLMTQPGNPIVQTWLSTDGHFAFCEMRSVEECTLALLLNQLPLLGQPLKFGRPRSYVGPPQPLPIIPERAQTALVHLGCVPNPAYFSISGLGVPGISAPPAPPVPSVAATTPVSHVRAATAPVAPLSSLPAAVLASLPEDPTSNRLLMTNIPVVLVEAQVRELVEPFGTLKSFSLLKDKVTDASTGTALFEYELASVTHEALQGLNGLDIGGVPLSVRRAPQDANAAVEETSAVVKLANMVSIDELKDDEEFADLKEDVEEECKRFGKVVDLVIPRPQEGEALPGVGSIFVRFNDKSEASAALKALSGRKFGGNIVQVTYFSLAKFESKDFA